MQQKKSESYYSISDIELHRAVTLYCYRHKVPSLNIKAALIDMDGVLYDSMPNHVKAWVKLARELGIECCDDEFYLYEGMTGRAILNLLFERGRNDLIDNDEEIKRLYKKKSEYFTILGETSPMPFASVMLNTLKCNNIDRVLVTGSGQQSIIDRLNVAYPGIFSNDKKITANDVTHCKPHPEPYLRGLKCAGVGHEEAIVIENAPLGTKAGMAAGCFTIAITTGPIPRDKIEADLIFPSMMDFAITLPRLLRIAKQGL